MANNQNGIAQWEWGTCKNCDVYDYVIQMRSHRKLCLECYSACGERTRIVRVYVDGTHPVMHNYRGGKR